MKKQHKETAVESQRKLLATPGYLESLDEAVQIILEGERGGRWKTLEEIEEERRRQAR